LVPLEAGAKKGPGLNYLTPALRIAAVGCGGIDFLNSPCYTYYHSYYYYHY
jgi:hypothetical protein